MRAKPGIGYGCVSGPPIDGPRHQGPGPEGHLGASGPAQRALARRRSGPGCSKHPAARTPPAGPTEDRQRAR
eukprot:9421415-Alexandrium_andersonii.AAC.1